MSRRNRSPKKEIVYHQQNPPPGMLAACGKVPNLKYLTDVFTPDRDKVNCPDCLSRPDPTIVIR